jgi:peptidyl-prolyl cis-trans isomerase A (cyclophilin A)
MDFAISLSTGKTYEASVVNYEQTKSLKLVCAVCKEKVFKRVRRIPLKTHMFVHYKGGSPGCELYSPSVASETPFTGDLGVSRGQSFEQFITDINLDLGNLLLEAQVLHGGDVDTRLVRLVTALTEKNGGDLKPLLNVVESHGVAFLSIAEKGGQANNSAEIIFEFYSRDGARFVDRLICNWALYCICVLNDDSDIAAAMDFINSEKVWFSQLTALTLGGLSLFYNNSDLIFFRDSFLRHLDRDFNRNPRVGSQVNAPLVSIEGLRSSGVVAVIQSPRVEFRTSMGSLTVELYPEKAPISVGNFLRYVDDGFYSGTIFHRVIADFMIQGGGLTADMEEKPNKHPPITLESKNGLRNDIGWLAMARSGEPNSATSQFFINTVNNEGLNHPQPDGNGYAVFGKVIEGMDTVDKIRRVKTRSAFPHRDVPSETILIESAKRR